MWCGFYRRGFVKEKKLVRGAYMCVWYMFHFANMMKK